MSLLKSIIPQEQGTSIIEALVAVAIVSILVMASVKMYSSFVQGNIKAESEHERLLVRDFIRENFDCEKTFAALNATDCRPGRYINAYDNYGKLLIKKDQPSLIGENHELRVSCPSGPDQLLIESRNTNSNNNPILKASKEWSDIFNGIPFYVRSSSSGLLDFESIPGARDGLAFGPDQMAYMASYGVTLTLKSGGYFRLARITERNDSEPQFKAWLSAACPGRPNNNRICSGSSAGRYALSVSNAKDTKLISFEIAFATPVSHFAFDILDLDGSESWSVHPFDSSRQPINRGSASNSGGYRIGRTGNSSATRFEVNNGDKSIAYVSVVGTKNIRIFGFGFDNFDTGISTCKAAH